MRVWRARPGAQTAERTEGERWGLVSFSTDKSRKLSISHENIMVA